MVLITGAGGQVGTALLKALSARGISVRAWIHRPAQRESVLEAGATEVFVGDMAVREDAEQALVNSELPYVILQPAVFMQMFAPGLQSVKHGGPFVQKFFSSNQTKMTFLDLEDYGEAVARIIEAGSFVYGTYELCADGAYSLTDLEAILSDIAGRKVSSAFSAMRIFWRLPIWTRIAMLAKRC